MVNNENTATIHYNMGLKDLQNNELDRASFNISQAIMNGSKIVKKSASIVSLFIKILTCDWSQTCEEYNAIKQIFHSELSKKEWSFPIIQPCYWKLLADISPKQLFELNHKYSDMTMKNIGCTKIYDHDRSLLGNSKRIKVGYISTSFSGCPHVRLVQGVFRMHNDNRFEIYCYSLACPKKNPPIKSIEQSVEHFIDISDMDDFAAAEQIYSDEIHVLVNLDGYSNGSRNGIFCLKPAPIRISLAQTMTMGADFVDYFVTNEHVVPSRMQQFFSEKLVYVPNYCNDYENCAKIVLNEDYEPYELRSNYQISEDTFVYACFSEPSKINSSLFKTWMNVLKQTKLSILLLLKHNDRMKDHLQRQANDLGVESSRLVFLDLKPFDEHIKRFGLVDLYLDTNICNGTATVFEALWSGTPTLCYNGELPCSRVSASLLNSIDMKDLVTNSLEEYEKIAISLNTDENEYIGIIRRLEEAKTSYDLFNGKKWVQNFEDAIEKIVTRFANNQDPDHITIQ